MSFGRLLLPALVFNTILFSWLLKDMWGESAWRKIVTGGMALIVIGLGLMPAWDINLVPESIRASFHFRLNIRDYWSEYTKWSLAKNNVPTWTTEGKLLKACTNPGDSLVRGPIGTVGYYSELFIYDQNGIVNHRVAMLEIEGRPLRSPGHDKGVSPEFFIDKRPTIFFSSVVSKQELFYRVRRMKNSAIAKYYVADYFPFPGEDGSHMSSGSKYLFILRRIEEGINPRTAWRRAMDSLAEIH